MQRPQGGEEGGEEGGLTSSWGKSLPDREKSQCKGPEAAEEEEAPT